MVIRLSVRDRIFHCDDIRPRRGGRSRFENLFGSARIDVFVSLCEQQMPLLIDGRRAAAVVLSGDTARDRRDARVNNRLHAQVFTRDDDRTPMTTAAGRITRVQLCMRM